jgi:Ca-activated chloride channel family protein
MEFYQVKYFHLLWAAAALAGVIAYGFYRKRQALARFATANLLGALMPQVSFARQKLKAAVFVVAFAFVVIAVADPRWGRDVVDVQRRGIDLIICLDVSRSMLAEDIAPNRLDRAKLEIGEMLREMRADRVGLITFAGDAVVSCPLTINYGAYRMTLNELGTRSTTRGGTQIGKAVSLAVSSFTDQVRGHKAILLVTDGEDQDSLPVEAAKAAAEKGIRVFTVGLGDPERGSRIPVVTAGQKQYLQYKGQQVWSRMNDAVLKEMAVVGGGMYFPVGTREFAWTEILDRIRERVEAREFETSRKELLRPQYAWFAGIALVLLLAEALMTDRRRPESTPAEVLEGVRG